jgi:catechol 2,3-dioxygenase-like lactoylglutathione lyase family enzyme
MEHIIAKLLQDFEQGKMSRRQLIQSLALAATASAAVAAPAAAADSKVPVKAVAFNHVSYEVHDYTKIRDFYVGVFGMQVSNDDGTNCYLSFGNNILIPRNRPVSHPTPRVDHIAYTMANWDTDKNVKPAMEANLKRLGVELIQGGPEPGIPHAKKSPEFEAKMKASVPGLHIKDPEGFTVQIGGKYQ